MKRTTTGVVSAALFALALPAHASMVLIGNNEDPTEITGVNINRGSYDVSFSSTALPGSLPANVTLNEAATAISGALDQLTVSSLGDVLQSVNVYYDPLPKYLAYMVALTGDTASASTNTAVMCQAGVFDYTQCQAPLNQPTDMGWTGIQPQNVAGAVSQVPNSPVELGLFDATTNSYVPIVPTIDPFNSTDSYVFVQSATITPAAVPLPPSAVLFGSGLLGLAGLQRKRKGPNA